MKKLTSLATILTVAAMVAGPGVAQGDTLSDLQAQYNALLAQLQTLQSQLAALGGTTTGGTVPAACAGITAFNTNLTIGSTGTDVKCLQALLNQSADTMVASTGAGSPGNETMYFGSLTQSAVAKYQVKHGINPPAGYFGPLTRASVNPMLVGTGTGTGTGTGVPGVCNGGEGSYTVTLSASPVSRTVNGGAGIEAYGIDVKAVNSDIYVGSIDLQAAVAVAGVAWSPSTFITAVKVYKDSVSDANLVKVYSSPSFNLDTSSVYYTSLTGLNMKVEKDSTHKVLIVLDTVESSDNNRTVTLNVYGNGVRGRDCLNIDRYQALATTRVLTVQPASGNATVTVTLASDNPDSQNIYSNPTVGVSSDTPILKFTAKSQSGSTTLTRITVLYTTSASDALASVMTLRDSSNTLISSCTPTNTACVFENFRYPLPVEETKPFTVSGQWTAMTDSSVKNVRGVNIPAAVQGVVYERSNGAQVGTAAAVLAAALNANDANIYERGVKFTFVNATQSVLSVGTDTQKGAVSGTVNFTVQPFGGAMTQLTTTGATSGGGMVWSEAIWASGTGITSSGAGANTITVTRSISQTPAQNLSDGQVGNVAVQLTVEADTNTYVGDLRFKVEGTTWAVGGLAGYTGTGSGGNYTDSWVSNWVHLTGR